jgi:Topoisomerase 6 subunit A/Spo11, Toprim domain
MTINAADILGITASVTKEWTKQRKAEERGRRSRLSRDYVYSDRVNFTAVAHNILPGGYSHASGNGRYTVDKRQFYYAVRDEFLEQTGREITADYFSQTLLVKYMNQHPEETAGWKITASPRATLSIPNTGHDLRIPCGTIAIEEHLAKAAVACDPFEDAEDISINVEWPSCAERQRYQAVLYIEKEGFDPQLREAKIASRFDTAIISCKGQSVVAARTYVDHVCRVGGGVPLFIAHDFDKAGFEISQRLTTVSEHALDNDLVKYEFQNEIDVTDLGLRLADVEKYGLKSERVRFKGGFAPDSIATEAEKRFLRSDRRVELNAFTAPDFIQWIENGLRKGLAKRGLKRRLIPDDDILEAAYRRALVVATINRAIEEARADAVAKAEAARVPKSLRRQLHKALANSFERVG